MQKRNGTASQRTSEYDAVIFDMDGVVTDTASLHAAAWKSLFDEVLPGLSTGPVHPFDPDTDYRRYIDGRSREDGISTFLASRGIELREGGPGETRMTGPIEIRTTGTGGEARATGPGEMRSTVPAEWMPDDRSTIRPTIAALAARKQAHFYAQLAERGVRAFPDTVALLHRLRAQGLPTALVTSSRNSAAVLAAAGVGDLFDVRVDGNDAMRMGLAGKPDPAIFLEAARQLRVTPALAVVVEDADAGVRAASRGGFGLVVGVDRSGGDRLRLAGADRLVSDLSELDLSLVREHAGWAGGESGSDPWLLRYDGFDPVAEGLRETLCTVGNGYWATRGAAPEAFADAVHYPGTYLAGVYNRVRTDLGTASASNTRTVEDEHLVNAPNWLPLLLRGPGDEWWRPGGPELIDYEQELDLRRGLLTRAVRYRDDAGRTTRVTDHRFISQAAPHTAVLVTEIEAEDWSGTLGVRSALDGRVANRNVAEYRLLAGTHLVPREVCETDPETILLDVETNQSGIRIAMAARTRVTGGREEAISRRLQTDDAGWVAHDLEVPVAPGHPIRVEKVVTVATSRDRAISSPALAVQKWSRRAADAPELLAAHERAWQVLWDEFGVHMHASERQSLALNLNIFHVLQTVAAVDVDLDAGVPARGLHGEGYRGHVFWDEVFVYPMLTLRRPDLSRALLGYRYRRLNEARAAAVDAGHVGAMFPWQSGIDGREETPTELYNMRNARWMPDNSSRQRHVGIAVAYSVWQYYQSTGDTGFLLEQGAELVIEVARFFASLAEYDERDDRYDIARVMGPDEFHDGYPGESGGGLRNNAYTNVMTAWLMRRAVETVALLESRYSRPLADRLRLRQDEVDRWAHIGRRLRVPFHADGVISQFEGYEALPEFDWDVYRDRYGSLRRLDLILNAEGDSTNNYRLSKQADVLMLLYLFSAEELRELLAGLGYELPPDAVRATVEFYGARSTHGSTLSNVVHSWVDARRDRAASWEFLSRALESDLDDVQGGTTHEGIHVGAMAGSVDMVVRCYTGLELRDDRLWLHPVVPPELGEVAFTIIYREQPVRLEMTAAVVRLSLEGGGASPIRVVVEGDEVLLAPGATGEFALHR